MPLGTSRGAPPFNRFGVLLGQGAGAPPVSTLAGEANSVLFVPANGARPVWTTSPTFTDAVLMYGRLDVSAPAGLNNALRILPNADDSATGRLVFRELEQNGTQQVTLQAPPALDANNNIVLPARDGVSGDALLTDGQGQWFFDTAPDRYNWLFNSDFEIWGQGTAGAPPTGWGWNGNPIINRATAAGFYRIGTGALELVRTTSNVLVFQRVDPYYPPVGYWWGRTLTAGCWVWANGPGAYFSLFDGVTSQNTMHPGNSEWQWLTATLQISWGAGQVAVYCQCVDQPVHAFYDGAVLVKGRTVQDWVPSGWRGRKA